MRPRQQQETAQPNPITRVRIWYACLLIIVAIFVVRLFYLQIIKHDYYQQSALAGQLKQYEIESERGTILAYNNGATTPIVLNEKLYIIYADPLFVKDSKLTAESVQKVLIGNALDMENLMNDTASRYKILAKKVSKQKRDEVMALKLKGIGAQQTNYRTYPQGTLAAQLLGFVNDEGNGQYGIEEALNKDIKGTAGRLKAITDAQGVPLAANRENIIKDPQNGKTIILTIDLGMQKQLEDIVKQQVQDTKSSKGSALIIEVKTGAVKAVANYPTYNPAEFYNVEDQSVYRNYAVSDATEVGSIMKPLTAAVALDTGSINKESSFYDPGFYKIGDATVSNVDPSGGPGQRTILDILRLSLNTGATWMLMQIGGGEINEKARTTFHDYLINHFQFGKKTGIEQSNEGEGSVPDPVDGFGLNIQYANMAFGQGQSQTLLQIGSAFSAVINGGTYYQPRLVDAYINSDGSKDVQKPKIIRSDVVSSKTSKSIIELMGSAIERNKTHYGAKQLRPEYGYGGKTGTSEIPNPAGGYLKGIYNGTFLGFIGGDEPEYVIVVSMNEPRNIPGYAGSQAAAPVYIKLVDMLINNFGVKPRG